MKKIAIAAALLAISASAHAGTSHHSARQVKVQTFHKDMSRMAMTKQEDAPAVATEATATPSDTAPAK